MAIVECVPNVSEGQRPEIVDRLAAAVSAVAGVSLLDRSSDTSHNRSVFTLAGEPGPLRTAVLALFEAAVPAIDLRSHRGVHPRMGAVDVVPFVPIAGVTMADCVALATATAADVAQRFAVPVYLYEEAAATPLRRPLEAIRRGQFEGLAAKMQLPDWAPDFGPRQPHPTAGATAIGARMPLVAYNVNLASNRLDVARQIATTIRESGGGLRCVKAMGVLLAARDVAQVSMNLTDYRVTPIRVAFEAVRREADRLGVGVLESELIGLAPAAALSASDARDVLLHDFRPSQILEERLKQLR